MSDTCGIKELLKQLSGHFTLLCTQGLQAWWTEIPDYDRLLSALLSKQAALIQQKNTTGISNKIQYIQCIGKYYCLLFF